MAKMIRIDEPSPNGGMYSELWFLDGNGNHVDETEAKLIQIRECDEHGNTVFETFAVPNN